MIGQSVGDRFGYAIVMSKVGLRVAIAAPHEDLRKGVVRIYEFVSSSNQWQQLGAQICGEDDSDTFGISMAMNDNGSRLVVGAPNNDG